MLLIRIVLACSMLNLAQSTCENLLEQDFSFYSSSTKYSRSLAQQDFVQTHGPYKMIEDPDQGVPLTTVGDGAIKGYFGKGKISGKETGALPHPLFKVKTCSERLLTVEKNYQRSTAGLQDLLGTRCSQSKAQRFQCPTKSSSQKASTGQKVESCLGFVVVVCLT